MICLTSLSVSVKSHRDDGRVIMKGSAQLVEKTKKKKKKQGPVVQSVVSLSSLRVISLTVLVDSIYNILIFLSEKM